MPGSDSVGFRHWTNVEILSLPEAELSEVVRHRFPVLSKYIVRIMAVYGSLLQKQGTDL